MINTTNLRKGHFGEFICIGGPPEDLKPLDYSLYNFGGINSTELLDLGDESIFQYLLVTKENYILARSKNIVINLEWNYKGQKGKLPWGIAIGRATRELNSIKTEDFLSYSTSVNGDGFNIDNERGNGYL
jgi:hypothetical protein